MLPPKIAEVKYTLIGLQDVCRGQASGDWLSRDKQVSGFRKYGPDKSLESPQSAKYMPCCLLHVVGINGGRSRAVLLKNLPKKLLITNLDSF